MEALHLAKANGIDLPTMLGALTPGRAAPGRWRSWAPRIAGGDFAPGFMIRLIQKDLRIVQAIAKAVGLPLEGTALAQSYFADNEAHGEGALGTQAM